jgi:hypothetical protein
MLNLYDQSIASYDDSFGVEDLNNPLHPRMHKLHHNLRMIIDGPDGTDIQGCIQSAATIGAIAAVIAAYTGGIAAEAAESAVTEILKACLGASCSVSFKDDYNWVYWNV